MTGLTSYGGYIPRSRLARADVAAALELSAVGRGSRAVASYDEDPTSMAVEAARIALAMRADRSPKPDVIYFTTSNPPYADKSNASVVHAALGLPKATAAFDMHGSTRSAIGVLRAGIDAAAAGHVALVTISDIRTGRAGSSDELQGGDAAAAFIFDADGDSALELLGSASVTRELIDRWQKPGDSHSHTWEERFSEHVYVPMGMAALGEALTSADITAIEIDHLVVTGTSTRAAISLANSAGVRSTALSPGISGVIGNAGVAQFPVELVAVLDRAEPGDIVVLVSLADGADVLVLRATDEISNARPHRSLLEQSNEQVVNISYARYLSWRGALIREPPRRPDPARPSSPASWRTQDWKFSFTSSECQRCGTRHLPPARICIKCQSMDVMRDIPLSNTSATISTFTIDHLAYSMNPPLVAAVLDFDGGGRFPCELTDVIPSDVRIGQQIEMTFRRLYVADGVHNYFWKGRPAMKKPSGSN